jgi:DNA-directed RNA polymerase subunit M/transcription elongation factor TFIIS
LRRSPAFPLVTIEIRPASEITPNIRDLGRSIPLAANSVRREQVKIAKTADRKKVMDTSKSTDCPKCGKPTRIVKRVKDRERNVPGGIFISCSGCDFYEKL